MMDEFGKPEDGVDFRRSTLSEDSALKFGRALRLAKRIAEQEFGSSDTAIIVQIASAISLNNQLAEINVLDWELDHIASAIDSK